MMRILLEIAFASAVLWVSAFARDTAEFAHVRVCLQNLAGAPSTTVDCAERECARIFRKAGIEVEWIAESQRQADDLRVIIAARPVRGTRAGVLGYVVETPAGASAFVVWPRALNWLAFDRPVYEIIGRVMAHEIGHLLLPDDPHAPVGLMRGTWPADDLRTNAAGSFFFTPDQQLKIEQQLLRRRTEYAGPSPAAVALFRGARGRPILQVLVVPRDISP
jgi:hypothetical protein